MRGVSPHQSVRTQEVVAQRVVGPRLPCLDTITPWLSVANATAHVALRLTGAAWHHQVRVLINPEDLVTAEGLFE